MVRGLTGSGAIDDSELKKTVNLLYDAVGLRDDLDKAIKMKVDASELKPARKSLDTIRKEVQEIGASDIELWNSKTIQRSIKFAQDEMQKLSRITHEFQEDFEDESQIKRFVEAFKTLDIYGQRFGKDLTSEYQNAFNSLLSNINRVFNDSNRKGRSAGLGLFDYLGFTPDSINSFIEELREKISKNLSIDINNYATDDVAKVRKKQYDEERRLAIESANEIEKAQRQKFDALAKTRSDLINALKGKLQDINSSASDGQYFEVDDEAWGNLQKKVYNLINEMSTFKMETKEISDLVESINNKVYVPKELISQETISKLDEAHTKIKELEAEIERLKQVQASMYSEGDVDSMLHRSWSQHQDNILQYEHEIDELYNQVKELTSQLNNSVQWGDWKEKCDEVEQLTNKVSVLENTIKQLTIDNAILKVDSQYKQSLDNREERTRETTSATQELDQSEEELINTNGRLSQSFDVSSVEKFNNTLRLIAIYLNDIRTALGTVDESSGFRNIISNIDTLLNKLDEVYQKIGNGVYNVNITTAGSYGSPADSVISREREKMMSAYDEVVKSFGEESLMYAELANTLGIGIDEFKNTYGREAIANTKGEKNQIDLLRNFFKRFDQYRAISKEFYEKQNLMLNEDIELLQSRRTIRSADKIKYKGLRSINNTNDSESSIDRAKNAFAFNTSSDSDLSYGIRTFDSEIYKSEMEAKKEYEAFIDSLSESDLNLWEGLLNKGKIPQKILHSGKDNLEKYLKELRQTVANNSIDLLSDAFVDDNDDGYHLKEVDLGKEKVSAKERRIRLDSKIKQRDYNVQKLAQLDELDNVTSSFLDDESLNREITEVTNTAQKEVDDLRNKSNEALTEINNKLSEIKETINNIIESNKFDELVNKVISKLDEVITKLQTINQSPLMSKSSTPEKTNSESDGSMLIEPNYEVSEFERDIKEYSQEVLSEEEKLKQVSSKVAQKIADDFGASGKSVGLLRDEVEQLLKTMQFGENINLDNIINILKNSPDVLEKYKKNYELWYQIRDYVSKSKIKVSSYDAEEFGDEWNKVRGVIGIDVLSSKEGSDAESFIRELTGYYGDFLGEVNNTQDALRKLYEFLSNRPNIMGDFLNSLNGDIISGIENRIQAGVYGLFANRESLLNVQQPKREPIIHVGTGKEISQEAYDVLDRLKRGVDVTVEELNSIPEVVEGFTRLNAATDAFIKKYEELGMSLHDTSELHTEEREILREYIKSIMRSSGSFRGIDENHNEIFDGEVRRERKAVIITGLPSSGKSTSLANPLSQFYGAKILDSDAIKKLLPEYDNGWGANLVHEESGQLNMDLLLEHLNPDNAELYGQNIIIPIVGGNADKLTKKYIEKLYDAGYEVELAENDVPNNEASYRNLLRYFAKNRFVRPDLVREYGDNPTYAFDEVKNDKRIKSYYKYSNNVKEKERPRFIEGGNVNQALLEFLADINAGKDFVDNPSYSEDEQIKNAHRLNELLEKRRELLSSQKDKSETDFEKTEEELSQINSEISEILTKKQELNNDESSSTATDSSESISQKTDDIKEEADAAQEATTKKNEFIEANKKLSESGEDTSSSIPDATASINDEGNASEKSAQKKNALIKANEDLADSEKKLETTLSDAASEAENNNKAIDKTTEKINEAESALDRYIRRQRGSADSGNYDFTQAINKVVDKDIQVRTDDEGNETRTEILRVNYDKLSKEILKTDTEIFKLQQQINNATQGNTSGLQKNLLILENQKKVYEDLLRDMVSNPEYEVDSSQVTILQEQRIKNQQWLQNIQDTKDSIAQLKANAASVSLGFDVEIKNNELVDYVDKLKDLGVYSSQAEKEANRLEQVLRRVSDKRDLELYVKQFKIFQQDMSSAVEGNKSTLNSTIREQVTAYKNIWNIRKQIAKLDSNKDANLIAELKKQEKEQIQIYAIKTNEIKAINQQVGVEQVLINRATIRKKVEEEIRSIKASQSDTDVKNRFDSIISKYKEIKQLNAEIQGLISAGVSSSDSTVTDRQTAIASIEKEIQAIKKLGFTKKQLDEINKAEASSRQVVSDAQAKQAARGALEAQQIERTRIALKKQASELTSNGKLMKVYGVRVNEVLKELENSNIAKDKLEQLRLELSKIKTEANLAGQSGKTFGQILKQRFTSLGAYIGTFTSFYRIIGGIRQAFSTITELDTQLVDLRKTTKMNNYELELFYQNSNNIAKQLGVTTSEIISQAAAWSRLGYSMREESEEMAKLSSKFTSISPGMTTDNATDYLVSTMKAYGVEVDEVERKILDNVNRIGNTFATTNAEIGEMLTRSSAAMNAANNSLEQTIALESAAVQITRNAETTGTTFRTVSMRIRGLDEETEEELEDYEELKGKIADLTKTKDTPGGISLFTDETKTEFKSTYQLLKDISQVWDQITDKDQAALLEAIGGKRGAQSLAGILSNFDEVERAMDEMKDAAGSADAEMGIIRDSISFKINELKQTWVGMLQEALNRDSMKNFIDALTKISNGLADIISKAGLLKTAIIGIATVAGSKGLGLFNTNNTGTIIGAIKAKAIQNDKIRQYQSVLNQFGNGNQDAFLTSNFNNWTHLSDDVRNNLISIRNEAIKTKKTGTEALAQVQTSMVNVGKQGTKLGGVFKNVGITLVNAFASAAIMTAITTFIGWIGDAIDSMYMTEKEAKELAETFSNSYSEMTRSTANSAKAISEIEDEFITLSSGVNDLGDNVSLTTEQFDRYHEITQIIADNIPDLVQGYDEQGNAIIRLRDKVSSLNDVYLENQRIAAQTLYDQKNDEDDSIIKGTYKTANDYLSDRQYYSLSNESLKTISFDEKYEIYKKLAKASFSDVQKIYNGAYENNTQNEYAKQLLEDYGFRYDTTAEEFNEIHKKFDQDIQKTEATLKANATRINEAGLTYAKAWTDYYTDLTDAQRKYFDIVVNSFDHDFLKENGLYKQKNMETYMSNLVNLFKQLDKESMEQIELRLGLSTKFNNGEITLSEYYNSIKEISEWVNGFDDETQKVINIIFGFETKDEEIDERVEYLKKLMGENWDDSYLDDFTSKDLEAIMNIQLKYNVIGYDDNKNPLYSQTIGYDDKGFPVKVYAEVDPYTKEEIEEQLSPVTVDVEPEIKASDAVDSMASAKQAISSLEDLYNQAFGDGKVKIEDRLTELSEGGTVNLNLRPEIDTSELEKAGWGAGGEIATVLTSTFSDELESKYLNFTPIIVDPVTGEYKGVLTPDELTDYAEGVIAGTRTDDLNLQIGAEFESLEEAEKAAREIHNLHEAKSNGETIYGGYDIIDVDKIQAVESAFGGIAEEDSKVSYALKEFERNLVEFPGDADVARKAINNLVTAFVDQTDVIKNLDESNAKWSEDQLRAMGVTNAHEVVMTRLNKQVKATMASIAKLADKLSEYDDTMASSTKTDDDKKNALKSLTTAVQDALRVYNEDGTPLESAFEISDEFVQSHIDDINAMAAGDIEALERVRRAAVEEVVANVTVNVPTDVAKYQIQDLMDEVIKLDSMDIEVGADVDDTAFIATLNNMLKSGRYSVEQIQAALDSMGYEAKISYATGKVVVPTGGSNISSVPTSVSQYLGFSESGQVNWHTEELPFQFPQVDIITKNGSFGGGAGAKYSAPSTNTKDTSSGGGGGGGGSEPTQPKEESEETFDWIEVALQRIEEEYSRLDKVSGNVYDTWDNRNKALTDELDVLAKKYDALGTASDEYFRNAEAVQVNGGKDLNDDDYGENDELVKAHDQKLLDEARAAWATGEYQKKVQEGQMSGDDIEKIANHFLADTIKEYQDWWNKGVEKKDQQIDVEIAFGDNFKEQFGRIKTQYDEVISYFTASADIIDEKINRTEKRGYFVSKSYYQDLKELRNKTLSEHESLYEDLIKKRDEAVDSGKIAEGSQAWHEMNEEINAVGLSIEQDKTQLVEYNNQIRQLDWDFFDWVEERISRINDEASFLIDLMSNDQLYNENGTMNDRGQATNAMYAVQYETYMRQAKDYAEERKKLEAEIAKDPANKDLIARYEDLVDREQEAIMNAEHVKDSVKSFVQEGINRFLEALQKLIDKYKEALHDSKDFYEYQKNIANQVKNIGNIRKQLLAYEGDDSEETRATVQKLRTQLEDAETQLKETQWDKYISETESFLDDMYEDMSETLNARLDDIDLLMHDMIDIANANTDRTQETIATETAKVGYDLTTAFDGIINGNESRLVTDLNTGFTNVTTALTNVQAVIEQIKNYAAAMVDNGNSSIDTVDEGNTNNVTAGAPQSKGGNGGKGSGNGGKGGNNGGNGDNGSGGGDNNTKGNNTPNRTEEDYYGVALAIINGTLGWGNGDERFKKLKEKGFDADKVQDIVNKLWNEGYVFSDAWIGRYYNIKDLNKFGYNKYAKGSKNITKDQLAWTQEKGQELIFRSSDGAMLTPLNAGDKVFTAQMTDNLWELAKGKYTTVPKTGGGNTINNSNAINITLPNVKNYEEFKTALQNDPKMTSFIQQVTLGEVSNGVKLNKRKY